jgi:hypothetical protein
MSGKTSNSMLAEIKKYKENIIQAIKNAAFKLVRSNPKKF